MCVKKAGTEATGAGLKAYQAVPACEQKPGAGEKTATATIRNTTQQFLFYTGLWQTYLIFSMTRSHFYSVTQRVTGTQCMEPPQAPTEASPPAGMNGRTAARGRRSRLCSSCTPLHVCVSASIFSRSITQPFEAHELLRATSGSGWEPQVYRSLSYSLSLAQEM